MPVTTRSIRHDSGSTTIDTSTRKLPADSQCQPMESRLRSESPWRSSWMKTPREHAKPARMAAEHTMPTVRRVTPGPTARLKPAPRTGVSRASQARVVALTRLAPQGPELVDVQLDACA